MARRFNDRPLAPRVGDLPVYEQTLCNGLRVLLLPRPRVPIVVCDLYYPVGSFDEPPGKTGLAHFLEHMLFKGTERFPKGHIDQLAFVAGGVANAETGEDCTHFWFMFPSDRWELALEIEADRMSRAQFDAEEVEAERQVIGEERAREMESPQVRLDQTLQAVAYLKHPYRNPVLGWPEDLSRIGANDLRAFYRAHYRPDGAVLVLAGEIEPRAALKRVEAHFGTIAPGPRARPLRSYIEPAQKGRREFTLVESESLTRGLLGWHTVPRGHHAAPAFDVLADILSSGRQSRLWRTLVEGAQLATWVEAAHAPARRGGQFFIQVECAAKADPADLERRIAEILSELIEQGPRGQELSRARNRLEAGWRWEQEDLAGLAAGIGQAALWGDWRDWQCEHAAALAVDAAAIQGAAGYLMDDKLTSGWSQPRARAGRRAEGSAARRIIQVDSRVEHEHVSGIRSKPHAVRPRPALPSSAEAGPARPPATTVPRAVTRLIDYHPHRTCLENGLRVIHERRPDTGVVALEFHVDAGCMREGHPGAAYLTGRLLEEGTRNRTAQELAAAIEDVGGAIDVASACVSLRVRAEDLALAIEILAELVQHPIFPADAVDWAKERIRAELQTDLEDPVHRAELLFRRLVYGRHPLGRDPRGSLRDIHRLTRDAVVAHHARHFAADRAFLVAVGDFETRALRRLVRSHLGSWAATSTPAPPWPPLLEAARPTIRRVACPCEQVHIITGHLGIPRHHPDFEALVVLDHIFGSGPGFADRLGRIVRDELGLVYSIGGGITDTADLLPGLFRVYAGTMPHAASRVVAAITDQVRAMHDGAFDDDEVDRARSYLASAFVFDFQTVEQRADRLFELERLGRPLDEPRLWPERIARITPDQVRNAARVHLRPDALFRVEYGPSAARR